MRVYLFLYLNELLAKMIISLDKEQLFQLINKAYDTSKILFPTNSAKIEYLGIASEFPSTKYANSLLNLFASKYCGLVFFTFLNNGIASFFNTANSYTIDVLKIASAQIGRAHV